MMKKRMLALVMTLAMCLSLLPVSALAAEGDKVAQIGETQYETLDAAIEAAQDGDTIELLADCTTGGMNLKNSLTIQAAGSLTTTPTITFEQYGIALWGKALTFRNCNVTMTGIGSTPYTAEWNWVTICANENASLTLDNVTMTMDGSGTSTEGDKATHAIYFCNNNKLNLINGSNLTIKNYGQDALEWNGGKDEYCLNITDSSFTSDHNRSGFAGTFYATIDNSTVKVLNSLGNGSNGTYYTIKNGSNVLFDGNRTWGISAWRIDMTNKSTLTATNNGYSGVWTRVLNVDKTCALDVEGNGTQATGFTNNAGIFFQGNGTYKSVIEKGADVTIKNNAGSGIYTNQSACDLTIQSGAITNNGTGAVNVTDKKGATYGGGIYNVGTIKLDEDVILYNNHADTAGDDIYSTGTITFGPVGSGWALDGAPDCTDAIDGWYVDGADSRWSAHKKPVHVEEFTADTVEGYLALKAAHGLIPLDPGDSGTDNWAVSKSKSATNLNSSYESQVTLSLPSAEEALVSDVVFVLDKSTSAALEGQALEMLKTLNAQVSETNAKVKVGVVIFNKEANKVLELTELNSGNMKKITDAIQTTMSSGTNTHAGLLAGKAMLDADTSVDANRKYLIFVSDGLTYMYNAEPTATAWSFKADSWKTFAGPDNWNSKYESNEAPANWSTWLTEIGEKITAQGTTYEYPYGGTATTATPQDDTWRTYAMTIDKALYLTDQVYQEAQAAGYHCYAMTATQEKGQQYTWGPSFMSYLADGEEVSFDDIQNDIYYLLAAGSKVEDYIGYKENDYNFDFVNDASKLSLKVGETTYPAEKIGENQYGFCPFTAIASETDGEIAPAQYAYVLTYVPGKQKDTEHFVWDINVPVSNFAPVQLTYTVKLTNPQTAAGTYGQYDADGSEKYAGLYTNNSATLYPVDSNSDKGVPENFPKPTVSYTVSGGSGGGGGTSKPTVLNTKDHYGYIIGYPVDYATGESTNDQTRMPVKPEGNITRAEVATIFFRMLTDDSRSQFWSQSSEYSDVKTSDWFNNAICTLSKAGILSGYENGTFAPNGKITRAEFATIASRFFEYQDSTGSSPFTDVDEGSWYYRYILAASEMGLINGYPDGTFRPNEPITRAEAVTIVNRTLDRHPDQDHFLPDMLVWPDNMDTTKWYYADMQEATNSHEYEMKGSGDSKYETWTKMLPIRDWAAFEKAWSDANSAAGGEVGK